MSKAAKEPRRQPDIGYHKDFKVWIRDTQIRPCFGTSEKDPTQRRSRADISATGTKLRVIAILNTLRDAEIPLNIGAMTYNAKCQRSRAFHIKYAIPPDVYISKFCPKYRLSLPQPISQLRQTFEERFRKDYYGDYLHVVQRHKDEGTAVVIPTSADKLVRAPDNELLTTGGVVLFNRAPLACIDLTDEVISEFEEAVINAFGDVWFSVCFYTTNDVPSSDDALICIGAKIDETKFIHITQPSKVTQAAFLRRYKYKAPNRKYH